ncbi:MAG: hypothetical protein ACAI34_03580 [Verrucomicrobium sp.]
MNTNSNIQIEAEATGSTLELNKAPAARVIRPLLFTESVSTSEEPAPYAESTLSLHEYRLLNPQTSGTPTLTQSRVLGAVLERIRIKARRAAERQARHERRTKAIKAGLMAPVRAMVALFHSTPEATVQRVGVRMTATRLALPRPS